MYDHTSAIRAVLGSIGLDHLTERDKAANDPRSLWSLNTPRTDCPTKLPTPPAIANAAAAPDAATLAEIRATPLPESGNHWGFIFSAAKSDIELSDGSEAAKDAVIQRVQGIHTVGDAQDYLADVSTRRHAAKAAVK